MTDTHDTMSPAELSALVRDGVRHSHVTYRAAAHLLTTALDGDLMDIDGVRRFIDPDPRRGAKVDWQGLAEYRDNVAVSGAGVTMLDLVCALAADGLIPKLAAALARLDFRQRRIVAEAFAVAAGVNGPMIDLDDDRYYDPAAIAVEADVAKICDAAAGGPAEVTEHQRPTVRDLAYHVLLAPAPGFPMGQVPERWGGLPELLDRHAIVVKVEDPATGQWFMAPTAGTVR